MKLHYIGLAMAGLFMAASPAQATITGNIDATITLTAACKINDTLTPDGGDLEQRFFRTVLAADSAAVA